MDQEPPSYKSEHVPGDYPGPTAQSQTVGPVSGQPMQVFVYARPPPIVYGNYGSKASLALGVIQIIVGVLSIIFNSVGLAYVISFYVGAYGLWGGILFIITGAFGISASKYRTRCKVNAFMVLCIISASVTPVLIVCGIFGATYSARNAFENCNLSGSYYYYDDWSSCEIAVAMESLLVIMGFIEGIVAIWGAAICCKAACCCNSTSDQVMMPGQYVTVQGNQPMIIVPQQNGQQMSFAQQGYPPQYPDQPKQPL